MSKITIQQLQEALENTKGKTPQEVIDAFCPPAQSVGAFPLLPITAGHANVLSSLGHPLVSSHGKSWAPNDVAILLFVFTRPSRELFRQIENGSFEDSLFEFLDQIPIGLVDTAAADLMAHWIRAHATAIPMESSYPDSGVKKKAASAGG